jgi:hypothetical protein
MQMAEAAYEAKDVGKFRSILSHVDLNRDQNAQDWSVKMVERCIDDLPNTGRVYPPHRPKTKPPECHMLHELLRRGAMDGFYTRKDILFAAEKVKNKDNHDLQDIAVALSNLVYPNGQPEDTGLIKGYTVITPRRRDLQILAMTSLCLEEIEREHFYAPTLPPAAEKLVALYNKDAKAIISLPDVHVFDPYGEKVNNILFFQTRRVHPATQIKIGEKTTNLNG